MNIKELLLVVGLALVTTWGIEYLFFDKKPATESTTVTSGQSFVAPKTPQDIKPLNVEVDFLDVKRGAPVVTTQIDTQHAQLVFSTDGASLERLEFKRHMDGWPQTLTTIFPVASTEREKRCFLVALEQETPFYYTLVSNQDVGNAVELMYQAEVKGTTVKKKFIVYKDSCKIDLVLTITPGQATQQARIFYPAPLLQDLAADDGKSGLVNDEKGTVNVIARAKINPEMYWASPSLFGADDRYFVNALVADEQHFTRRGYFKLTGQADIAAVLEGPVVQQETTWHLSFYFGPKESKAMLQVDPRLEQTLGYAGWLAPLSKWLLVLLVFLYHYLGNYGLAIIALTILVKLVLLPFSIKGSQGMRKNAEVQKKLKYLQAKYKDDPETLARERAELMRREGLTSLSGCLPLLLQLPIFFALSRVLSTSLELYQAPFMFWITDLSAKDPYYVLPMLIAASMLLQAATVDASQRVQLIVMALVFGALTSTMSAGLCLYIFMSTILGVLQTVVQRRFGMA
jgi:YidC/Oxa1 family membrane protein insertase